MYSSALTAFEPICKLVSRASLARFSTTHKHTAARRDYYKILNVDSRADARAIRRAYLKLVKQYHPDVNVDPHGQTEFIKIKEAFDVLSDRKKRMEYDAKLLRGAMQSTVRPFERSSDLGYAAKEQKERYERYKRYTNGESLDDDQEERFTWIKTLAAVTVSGVAMYLLALFANEFLQQNGDANDDAEDGAALSQSDVAHDTLVDAYYNPKTGRWERIVAPYTAPPVDVFIKHYGTDLQGMVLPTSEFKIIKMPKSATCAPCMLYDANLKQMVTFTSETRK